MQKDDVIQLLRAHADAIKAICTRLGLTQTAFAQRYGFNRRTLQDWEQHRRRPEPVGKDLAEIDEASHVARQSVVAKPFSDADVDPKHRRTDQAKPNGYAKSPAAGQPASARSVEFHTPPDCSGVCHDTLHGLSLANTTSARLSGFFRS